MSDLDCSVCLHRFGGNISTQAITIANGQAVCHEHFDEIHNLSDLGPVSLLQIDYIREHPDQYARTR